MLPRISRAVALLISITFASTGGPVALGDKPVPIGTSTMSITYPTLSSGDLTFSGTRAHDGTSLANVTNLGGAPNVGAFSAVNTLGRRPNILIGPDETLMRHGYYKMNPSEQFDFGSDFFPDIDVSGMVTIAVDNIQFDRPIHVVEDTFLFHALFDDNQVGDLAYVHLNSHHIPDPFRDFDQFFGPGLPFFNNPANYNFMPAEISPIFTQNAPDTISVTFRFPYMMLEHLENNGAMAPDGLPAPAGFLEPFHIHMEYLVAPEPASGLVMLAGMALLRRRRR